MFRGGVWPPASGERGEWWPAHNSQGQRPDSSMVQRYTGPSHSIIQPTHHTRRHNMRNKRGELFTAFLTSFDSFHDAVWKMDMIVMFISMFTFISTPRTMSPASAPLHTYVLRAWLSWLLMRGERGEWLEGPPWGSSQQDTQHLTAKFRKLRDELQRGNKERGVETKTLCCHFMSLLNWFKYFFYS